MTPVRVLGSTISWIIVVTSFIILLIILGPILSKGFNLSLENTSLLVLVLLVYARGRVSEQLEQRAMRKFLRKHGSVRNLLMNYCERAGRSLA